MVQTSSYLHMASKQMKFPVTRKLGRKSKVTFTLYSKTRKLRPSGLFRGLWRWERQVCPETSVSNYHYELRISPEVRSYHLLRLESRKTQKSSITIRNQRAIVACLCFADFGKATVLLEPTLIDRYTPWWCGWHTQQGPGLRFAPAGGCKSILELVLRY